MSGQAEQSLFKGNQDRFNIQKGGVQSANTHDAIDFDAFAMWWNGVVKKNEESKEFGTGIFRKTAALLRAYYSERKRVLNIAATIAAVVPAAGDEGEAFHTSTLRDESAVLRGALRDSSARGHGGEQQEPAAPSSITRSPSSKRKKAPSSDPRNPRVIVPMAAARRASFKTGGTRNSSRPAARPRRSATEGSRKDPVCKRCGLRKNSNPIAKGKHSHRCKKNTEGYCRVDKKHWLEGYPLLGYSVGDPDASLDVDVSKDEPPSKRQKNKTKASHITPKIEELINHFEENGSAELPGCGTSLRNLWDNCTRATGRRHADEFDAGCASCRFMSMAYEKNKINKKRKDGVGPSVEQGRKENPTRVLRNKRKKVETKVETSDDDDDDDDDSDNSDNDDEFLRNSR